MDLHFTVFNLLYRDPGLRRLLINYADRVEYSKVADRQPATTNCFLTLKWAQSYRALPFEDGSEILTVRVHMPHYCWSDHRYLSSVLHRAQAALGTFSRSESIQALLLQTSCAVTKIGGDTIFMSSTLQIAPASSMSR